MRRRYRDYEMARATVMAVHIYLGEAAHERGSFAWYVVQGARDWVAFGCWIKRERIAKHTLTILLAVLGILVLTAPR